MRDRISPSFDVAAALASGWETPAARPMLAGGSVHVWRVPLSLQATQLRQLSGTLSADEVDRASRFVHDTDRRRFVAARGRLRQILSHYLTCTPERVTFRYNAHGKPELDPAAGEDALHFSVSHTFDLAVFAFLFGRRVGVDIERVRRMPDLEAVMREVFSDREQALWRALPERQRPEAFFNGWTRKEAWLKAVGVGLTCPPSSIEVALGPDEPTSLVAVDGDTQQASDWSLVSLKPAAGYVGALAVEGRGWRVRYLDGLNSGA